MRPLALLFVTSTLVLSPSLAFAQSAGFRAQAKYYAAKAAYESRRFGEAIDLVNEAKDIAGGTNERVQLLHVLAAYHGGRYSEARREITRFFAVYEREEPRGRFSGEMEPISPNEQVEIARILEDVDRKVASGAERTNARNAAFARLLAQVRPTLQLQSIYPGCPDVAERWSLSGPATALRINVSYNWNCGDGNNSAQYEITINLLDQFLSARADRAVVTSICSHGRVATDRLVINLGNHVPVRGRCVKPYNASSDHPGTEHTFDLPVRDGAAAAAALRELRAP